MTLSILRCRRWRLSTAGYLVFLLPWPMLSGCGRYDVSSVSGVVRLDGQPLPKAIVTFTPLDGRSSVATSDDSGRYVLQYTTNQWGAERGQHQVTITTRVDKVTGEDGAVLQAGRKELLPARYHEKTELTAEVKRGRNTIDFDLTSTAK